MTDLIDILAWFISLLGKILGAIPKYGEDASGALDKMIEALKGTVSR